MDKLFRKNKVGAAPAILLIVLMLIVGGLVGYMWAKGKSSGGSTALSVVQQSAKSSSGNQLPTINLVDKTTVTLASWDIFNKNTNAGVGHLLLELKDKQGNVKKTGTQYADDGTDTWVPGDTYKVLIGNLTSGFTAGTTFYPVYVTGTVPDSGAYSVSAGQYKSAGASQVTFTFFNTNTQVNTAEALTTSDDKTPKWKLQPNADTCVGNPDTQGNNVMTYYYDSGVYSSVVQYNAGTSQSSVGTPNGAQNVAGLNSSQSKVSYEFPTVCGPAFIERQVRVKTGSARNPVSQENINMTVSDLTWDYDTKTLDLLKGYTNNNNVDAGVADFFVGNILVS